MKVEDFQVTIDQVLEALDNLEESWHNATVEDEARLDREEREQLSKELRTFLKMIYTPLQIAVYTDEEGVKGVVLNRLPMHPVDIIEFRYALDTNKQDDETPVQIMQPEGGQEKVYVKRHPPSASNVDLNKMIEHAPPLPEPKDDELEDL